MKKSRIKQLESAYTKKVKNANKSFFVNKETGLVLFIEHLSYLRDSLILNTSERTEKNKARLASMTAAIAEFQAYKNSSEKSKIVFHWDNFCEILKLNMEEWLGRNDSV